MPFRRRARKISLLTSSTEVRWRRWKRPWTDCSLGWKGFSSWLTWSGGNSLQILEENISLLKAKEMEMARRICWRGPDKGLRQDGWAPPPLPGSPVLQAERGPGAFSQALGRWRGSTRLPFLRNKLSGRHPRRGSCPRSTGLRTPRRQRSKPAAATGVWEFCGPPIRYAGRWNSMREPLGCFIVDWISEFLPLLHLTMRGSEEQLEPVCPALAGGLPAAAPPGGASEISQRRHFPPPAFGLPGVRKDEAFSSERWLVDTGTWSSVLSEGLCTGIKGSSLDATWLLGSRVGWSVCEPQCPLAPWIVSIKLSRLKTKAPTPLHPPHRKTPKPNYEKWHKEGMDI